MSDTWLVILSTIAMLALGAGMLINQPNDSLMSSKTYDPPQVWSTQ